MEVNFFPMMQKKRYTDLPFQGKSESFIRLYNRKMKDIPLKATIIRAINDKTNLLGEGMSKKGYNFPGFKDYVIRVYKKLFQNTDLESSFVKPSGNYLDLIEEVVLCIPDKIDIVKKKTGRSVGVDNYAQRIGIENFPPLRNVSVSREESLNALKNYESLSSFPLKSFKLAYTQIKQFCKQRGFQFDIISPNNILVDVKNRRINLIDPVTPEVNEPVYGKDVDFNKKHGADSLYPVLCDFIMHKEHLQNLTDTEKLRWQKAVHTIILKCIQAGKESGYERNIEQLKGMYSLVSNFWQGDELIVRYQKFLDMYADAVNQSKIIQTAVNYRNSIKERISAIKKLDTFDFNLLKPVFEQILEAPHQPKVEFPEIIDALLDKLKDYDDIKLLLPALTKLFDKEIFYTTKKRLYNIFIKVEPENEKFKEEISKSARNPLEKVLYKKELMLLNIPECQTSSGFPDLSEDLINKICISRTCSNSSKAQKISLNNMIEAYKYIESAKNRKPGIQDLIELHKTVLKNTPGEEHITGRLRTPETDEIVRQIFHIKQTGKKPACDYSNSEDVVKDLEKLEQYLNANYDTMDTFDLAANLFSEIIRIHPFVNGNGRATRLFVEQSLLNKGYRLEKWPEEALYRKIYTTEQLSCHLKQNSTKINY